MGMYTELIIEVKLKDETPNEIIKCLQDMVNDIENPIFTYNRNPLANYCRSNEYPPSFNELTLMAHGEIKNLWKDIDRFIIFIKPYVEKGLLDHSAFAMTKYEEFDNWEYYYI